MPLVQPVGTEPLKDEDGGAGGVHAEHQDQGPGRVVVGLWTTSRSTLITICDNVAITPKNQGK